MTEQEIIGKGTWIDKLASELLEREKQIGRSTDLIRVESGLGASGMVFFITPTAQFLLGFFYFNETFSYEKLIGFILIWIAVFIYLRDLYEKS